MAPPAATRARGRTAYALLFLALFLPFSYFNHNDGWNQGARVAQLHAIVLKHTITIDAYHQITGDKAFINGHYYSEKAPAMVAMALPSFALTVWLQKLLGVDPDQLPGWRVSGWIATAASIGLLTALGGVAFFELLRVRFDPLTALTGTFGLFLGSLTWPYATSLFAHAGTIGLLCIALWAALGKSTPRHDCIAGLSAGLAVASEYPGVIPCAMIGMYLGFTGWPRLWRFALGTIPAALLILINNYLTTGAAFSLTYGANANFPEMSTGNAMGFRTPDWSVLLGQIVGEYRGLFFWCPALLMSVVGLVEVFKKDRTVAVMLATTIGLMLIQVAAFYSAFGGNSIGPRYLAPALPFIGLVAAYGIKRWPEPGFVLMLVSIAIMLGVTAIAIDPPGDVLTPLESFYLVRLREHRFADNLGTLAGMPVWLSLLVPLVPAIVAAWYWLKEPAAGV
ncbi:MAG: hypothetical protein K2Y23_13485 [Cyanobacteria bacterium]|nr:hypothetical protein [Cyanobacteriota bacterium]